MKKMTNKLPVVALAIMAFSVSIPAVASGTVRIVITQAPVVPSQSATNKQNHVTKAPIKKSTTCVPTPKNEGEWCIGGSTLGVMRSNSLTATNASPMQVISLPSYGYTAEEVAQHLNTHSNVGYVEADLEVSTRNDIVTSEGGVISSATNDPAYSTYQRYYFESADVTPSGSNIVGLWDAAGMPNITQQSTNAPDVLVFDSEFVANSEVPYYSGRNFSTTALTSDGEPQKRSDDYRPPAGLTGCQSHGLNVSSIIAAKINNATGIAGVTNNVKVHAIKALTCGTGFLSDVADGLWWASGVAYEGVTPYAGKPGVINMSISAPISSSEACPNYLQTAIDEVTAKGFVVVNSAGNYSSNTVGYVPAKCNNVITVASVDRTGDKAGFSNYGDEVDIMVQGDEMAVICSATNSGACYGQGTSYSAPLVSAALTVTQHASKVTPAELGTALSITARTDTWGSTCASGVCGDGIMDASKLYQVAKAVAAGTANRLEHVLANKEVCEQQWYLDHFGHAARLCEMYKLTMMNGITKEGVSYRLYSVPMGDTMGESAQFEGEFSIGTVILHNLMPSIRDYAIRVCQNGDCKGLQAVDSKHARKPAACN
ncbi:S8 family serine peptidase [Shewanella xiamenensis]|uniref:S8 family serine peptidase n=1 Tax=Shewanella xiamenensis TaxID=332186 RepID=UPI0035B91722